MSILLLVTVCKFAVLVANSADLDQTPHSAHCLFRPVCPNTQSKYGNLNNRNPSEIILDPPLLYLLDLQFHSPFDYLLVCPKTAVVNSVYPDQSTSTNLGALFAQACLSDNLE